MVACSIRVAAGDLFELEKGQDFCGAAAHGFDALLVGAELVAAMDESAGRRRWGETMLAQSTALSPPPTIRMRLLRKRLKIVDEIMQAAADKMGGVGERQGFGLEGPHSRGDEDDAGAGEPASSYAD